MSRCDRCPLRPSQKLVYPVTCFCGHVLLSDEDAPQWKDDKEKRQVKQGRQPVRLGDFTEAQLKAIGITPERYKAVKELFGFAPTCDCEKRQRWLNAVSDWWNGETNNSNIS